LAPELNAGHDVQKTGSTEFKGVHKSSLNLPLAGVTVWHLTITLCDGARKLTDVVVEHKSDNTAATRACYWI